MESKADNFRKVQKLVKEGKISDRAASLHAALGTAPTASVSVDLLGILKELGFVYSDENEAWMHSEHGTGFTSQIDVRVLKRLHNRLAQPPQH